MYRFALALLAPHLPLEVVWTIDDATSVTSSCNVAIVPEEDTRLSAVQSMPFHWFRKPYCSLYIVHVVDADEYKEKIQRPMMKWVEDQEAKQLEWGIIVVEPVNWGILRALRAIPDRVRTDAKQGDRVIVVVEGQTEECVPLLPFVKKCVGASFARAVKDHKEHLGKLASQKGTHGWNFTQYFVMCEGLAFTLERAGLRRAALQQYLECDEVLRQLDETAIKFSFEKMWLDKDASEGAMLHLLRSGNQWVMRNSIYRSEVSVFALRLYMCAREVKLLLAEGCPEEALQLAGRDIRALAKLVPSQEWFRRWATGAWMELAWAVRSADGPTLAEGLAWQAALNLACQEGQVCGHWASCTPSTAADFNLESSQQNGWSLLEGWWGSDGRSHWDASLVALAQECDRVWSAIKGMRHAWHARAVLVQHWLARNMYREAYDALVGLLATERTQATIAHWPELLLQRGLEPLSKALVALQETRHLAQNTLHIWAVTGNAAHLQSCIEALQSDSSSVVVMELPPQLALRIVLPPHGYVGEPLVGSVSLAWPIPVLAAEVWLGLDDSRKVLLRGPLVATDGCASVVSVFQVNAVLENCKEGDELWPTTCLLTLNPKLQLRCALPKPSDALQVRERDPNLVLLVEPPPLLSALDTSHETHNITIRLSADKALTQCPIMIVLRGPVRVASLSIASYETNQAEDGAITLSAAVNLEGPTSITLALCYLGPRDGDTAHVQVRAHKKELTLGLSFRPAITARAICTLNHLQVWLTNLCAPMALEVMEVSIHGVSSAPIARDARILLAGHPFCVLLPSQIDSAPEGSKRGQLRISYVAPSLGPESRIMEIDLHLPDASSSTRTPALDVAHRLSREGSQLVVGQPVEFVVELRAPVGDSTTHFVRLNCHEFLVSGPVVTSFVGAVALHYRIIARRSGMLQLPSMGFGSFVPSSGRVLVLPPMQFTSSTHISSSSWLEEDEGEGAPHVAVVGSPDPRLLRPPAELVTPPVTPVKLK